MSLAGSPPAASSLASEESLRTDLSGVLALAFEPVAAAMLAKLRGEETAEECERQISAALSEAGCGIVRAALDAGDPAAEQLALDDRPYYCAGKQRSRVMSSFGLVEYERNRYRRRNCDTITPADDRFGIVSGFWWSRMKCSRIRWFEHGTGQAILSFRALWKSGRFDPAWRQIMLALEPETYTLRNRSHHNILELAN